MVDIGLLCIYHNHDSWFGRCCSGLSSSKTLRGFFIPLSVAILGEILSVIGGFLVTKAAHKAEHEFLSKDVTFEDLKAMDNNNDGQVSEVEFVTHMLVSMDKCDQELIDDLRELFIALDAQKNGVLEPRDLEILDQRKKNRLRQMGSTVRQGECV